MPGTQSIRTGLCVGQTSREPANLSATAGTRKALRKTIVGPSREDGNVHRGCRGLKLKRDSRTDSLVGSEDSNFAWGLFPTDCRWSRDGGCSHARWLTGDGNCRGGDRRSGYAPGFASCYWGWIASWSPWRRPSGPHRR
jgi:hypothetical protein